MVFTVEINDQRVTAKKGETILSLLNRHGINVPTLCNINGFPPTGSCRVCVVEVEGVPGLVPSCSQPVEEWMKIYTHSSRVIQARKAIVELLLAGHPDDCLYCSRNGDCELQTLAEELNISDRKFRAGKRPAQIDKTCPSVERDPSKCILCERCIRICDTTIGVGAIDVVHRGSESMIGTTYNKGLNPESCIKCGQCIMICPTAAITEKSDLSRVVDALTAKQLFPVIQLSPTTASAITEAFGFKSGKDVQDILRTALRMMGFKYIMDTSFAADIAIMEEAREIARRLETGKNLPALTASCPSFVRYIHAFRPALIPNLLPVKSPQQIMGTLIKNYVISPQSYTPEKVFSVSVMPCTAKKAEAAFESDPEAPFRFVDAVLTNRELIRMIRLFGIDLSKLEPEPLDLTHGIRSSAGKLFGVAGGPLEGMLRTLYHMITGQEMSPVKITDLRGLKEVKESRIRLGKQSVKVMAVSGLGNAIHVLNEIENGRDDLGIIEVMTCPFGCINGGGQPRGCDEKGLKARMKSIYDVDEEEIIKSAHKNPNVQMVYDRMLGHPGSERSRDYIYKKAPAIKKQ
jgi:iron-only hydrogenase group A